MQRGRLSELQLLPDVLEEFVELLADLPVQAESRHVRADIDNQVTTVAESIALQDLLSIDSRLPSMTLNTSRVSVIVPVSFDNFGGKASLLVTMTTLPVELLGIDPMTQSRSVHVYQADAADPSDIRQLGGSYSAESVPTRVSIQTNPTTSQLLSPLTIVFRASADDADHLPESFFRCSRWSSGAIVGTRGGWIIGDCWYLGRRNNHHVCQCRSSGTYVVLRLDGDTLRNSTDRPPKPTTVVAATFLSIIFLCSLIRTIVTALKSWYDIDVEAGLPHASGRGRRAGHARDVTL